MAEPHKPTEYRDTTERVILIVDDEPQLLQLTVLMCDRVGYRAEAVGDSRSAVREFKKDPHRILLTILDGTIEGAEDAFSTMRAVRPRLPVIIASGYADYHFGDRFVKGEFPTILAKPYTRTELEHAIDTALSSDSDFSQGSSD